jgi:hypothetical protein
MLEDFEDGDNANKIGTYWYFWADSFSVIHNAGPENRFTGGYGPGNASSYAGVMDFTIKKGVSFPEVGMAFKFDPAEDSVDLSGASAVQFDAKANRPMVIQFRAPQSSIHDYNYYNAKVNIDTSWTTVQVLLKADLTGDLSQETWGAGASFELSKLTGFEWIFRLRDGADTDSSGRISIDNVKLVGVPAGLHAPFAPLIVGPGWGATGQPLSPRMLWRSSAGASSYHLQISKSKTFGSFILNLSGITDTVYPVTGLEASTTYYWRVNATDAGFTSRWSYATFFTTMGTAATAIIVNPLDSSARGVFDSLRGLRLAKSGAGLTYWPEYSINTLGFVNTGKGYKVYTDSLDTLRTAGAAVDAATTPVPLSAGWNLAAYLPQTDMAAATALSGVVSQLTLVKNGNGEIYWPDEGLNTIGTMRVGQGYKIHMKTAAVLTYPAGGSPKTVAEGTGGAAPRPRHFTLSRTGGGNATIAIRRIIADGAPAADNCEIGAFDERGTLVGNSVVRKGKAALCVWGDDPLTVQKDGCADGEKLSFKLWDGMRECPVAVDGAEGISYAEDALLTAAFSTREATAVTAFSLRAASPNPFRKRTAILFDVPAAPDGSVREVEIAVYGINGCLIRQLVKGKYAAGRYGAAWDAVGDAPSGSTMYVVRMKAGLFARELRLFRVK